MISQNKLKKLLSILILFCFSAKAANHYISNTGSDAANGLTTSTPWLTIAKVVATPPSAGDTIFFKRGDTWRERLALPSSGTYANRIVYTGYGTGAKPIINGANVQTGWVSHGSNIWVNVCTMNPTTATMIIVDDSVFQEASALVGVTGGKYWINTAGIDSVYIYSATNPSGRTIQQSVRDYCIVGYAGTDIKYTNFIGLECRYSGGGGIALYGSGSQYVSDCIVDSCYFLANRLWGAITKQGARGCIFRNSSADYNGNGFYCWQSDSCSMQRDSCSNSFAYTLNGQDTDGGAMQDYQSDYWVVEYCYSIHDNDAIHIDAGSTAAHAIIRYNKALYTKIISPNTPGFGVGSVTTGGVVQIYYNISINNSSEGIDSYTASTGSIYVYNNTFFSEVGYALNASVYLARGSNWVFKNNIIARLGQESPSRPLVEVDFAGTIPTLDYNQYYQATPAAYRWYYAANYSTIATWRTATSQDAHSTTGDPVFVNNSSDWKLQSTSPCINAGVSLGLTQDIDGNPIVGNPDIGAYEYTTSHLHYVATTGTDIGTGTFGQPWATWQKGFNTIVAGDTLYIRGGTYTPTVATTLYGVDNAVAIDGASSAHDGTIGSLITVLNYPSEIPVLDASSATTLGQNCAGIYLPFCDYWYIKGITVKSSLGYGLYILAGNNNTLEQCITHHNTGTGTIIQNASEGNLIHNCDSYANYDAPVGDNADGFEVSFIGYRSGSPRLNTMRGCRSWFNSDDGVDNFKNDGYMVIDSCWSFSNGYAYNTTTHKGDGNGLKLGLTDSSAVNGTFFLKTITSNLVFDNYADGIEQNAADCKFYVYNNTVWNNGNEGIKFSDYNLAHVIRNNVSWGNAGDQFYGTHTNATVDHNSYDVSWQPSGPVASAGDFASIDTTGVTGARQANGSLPVLTFMHLTSSSDLINAGIYVGIPYSGTAPDLGAFEFVGTVTTSRIIKLVGRIQ